jgi:hypothetical protein
MVFMGISAGPTYVYEYGASSVIVFIGTLVAEDLSLLAAGREPVMVMVFR